MKEVTLSIAQVRRWAHPQNWMINGYSQTQDISYLPANQRHLGLPAGGWTLSAADLLRIFWMGPIDQECIYHIEHNQTRVYIGLWTPRLAETVTESWFHDGDLWAINYRLLKVTEA